MGGAGKGRRSLFNEARTKPKSCVTSICWHERGAAWQIQLVVPQSKKRVTGGSLFQPNNPSAHQVQIAFQEALAALQNLQRTHALPVTEGGTWHWIDKSPTSRKK